MLVTIIALSEGYIQLHIQLDPISYQRLCSIAFVSEVNMSMRRSVDTPAIRTFNILFQSQLCICVCFYTKNVNSFEMFLLF